MKKLVCIAIAAAMVLTAAACAPAVVSAPRPDPAAAPVEAAPTAAPEAAPEAVEPEAAPADGDVSGAGAYRGCPAGNAVNGGLAAASDGALYYAGDALYKRNADGIAQSISDGVYKYINVMGDTLWCVEYGSEREPEIVSMKTDGSGKATLVSGYVDCLSVVGDHMYYLLLTATDDGFCSAPFRAQLDGSDAQRLTETDMNYRFLSVVGDYAYFADYDPAQEQGHIYRVGVSQGEPEAIIETGGAAVNLVAADGGKLLYSAADEAGEMATFVVGSDGSVLQKYGLMSAVNADADYIYYVDAGDDAQAICRMAWTGEAERLCAVDGAYQLCLAGDTIVYYDGMAMYTLPQAGGQPAELFREEIEAEG